MNTLTLRDDLRRLGTTSKDVAKSLRRLGIKGTPREEESCPIANFITKRLGWVPDELCVTNDEIEFAVRIPTPKVLARFIDEFDGDDDKGRAPAYPELVKKGGK